jgi:leader peptidase (prepilin peptidase)/N-methyltransferase
VIGGAGLVGLCAVLGLLIGSFLNVVVYRVPRGQSVNSPPSACPRCGQRIKPWDNVPVLSWLMLRGRCRHCALPISGRYPIVEAATGAMFAALAAFYDDARLPVLLYLGALGLALALIDLEHHRLPFVLTVPAIPISAALLVIPGVSDGWSPLASALGCAGIWGGLIGILWAGTGGNGMGFGDVVLAPTLGLVSGWIGWGAGVIGLSASFASGALIGVALIAVGRAGRKSAVPFGPFLILGAAIGLVVGQPIWHTFLDAAGR